MEKVVEATREGVTSDGINRYAALLPALQRLDRLIERAAAAAADAYGPEAAADPYRGYYIGDEEVTRLLARTPGAPMLWAGADSTAGWPSAGSPLAWLQQAFGLSAFDLDLLLIALAPELDLRYERLYAYLQDDVTRRHATVDLALNLLCGSAEEKLARRAHLAPDAPLVQHGLLQMIADPSQVAPPLLAHYLALDGQIVRFVLGSAGLDPRLAPFCKRVVPTAARGDELGRGLLAFARQSLDVIEPLRLYFEGPRGAGKRAAAEGLAGELGLPLLVANLARAGAVRPEVEQALKVLFREARLTGAVLYVDGFETVRSEEWGAAALWETVADSPGMVILAGTGPLLPPGQELLGVIPVPFPMPGFEQRRACWADNLAAVGGGADEATLDALSGRFRLTRAQIAQSVASAAGQARWRSGGTRPTADGTEPSAADLFAAARAQSGHELARLAHKLEPVHSWDDIVLPTDTLAQLHEICERVTHRHRVLAEWGFGQKLALGKGLTALFSGPSGTGKTMAAGIIARELELDLYRIDLSRVVSKYIGETEKNLDRIFAAAEAANAILFFDEADALFGKRSQVKDSHDRYANVEISYLLQKMEEHDGVAILATNLQKNMDEAFVRRLSFTVPFPFPAEEDRLRIWRGIWPADTPRAADLDLAYLARQFKLAGGNIKNIALAAAFLAAADGQVVDMEHLVSATKRELQKMRKAVVEREFGPYGRALTPNPLSPRGEGAAEGA